VNLSVIVAVALGLLVGVAGGGRLANLAAAATTVRLAPLAVLALVVQGLALSLLGGRPALVLVAASLAGLVAFSLRNLARPGFWLLLAGTAMNLLVIVVNGGMPVREAALEAAGRDDIVAEARANPNAKHHLSGPGDRLTPLSDVIPVPGPGRSGSVVAPGDLLVDLGLAWFLAAAMRRRPARPGAPPAAPTGARSGPR
jgi:hypothetical protein